MLFIFLTKTILFFYQPNCGNAGQVLLKKDTLLVQSIVLLSLAADSQDESRLQLENTATFCKFFPSICFEKIT